MAKKAADKGPELVVGHHPTQGTKVRVPEAVAAKMGLVKSFDKKPGEAPKLGAPVITADRAKALAKGETQAAPVQEEG